MELTKENVSKKYHQIKRWVKDPRQQLIHFIKSQITEELSQFRQSEPAIESTSMAHDISFNLADTIPPAPFNDKVIEYYVTRTGNYYLPLPVSNEVSISSIKNGEIVAPEIAEIAKEFIKPGSTVLDIGAQYGQLSVLFSKMTGPLGQVLSFETDDFLFYLLQKNITANQCENVRAFFGTFWEKSNNKIYYPEQISLNNPVSQTLIIDDLNIKTPISFMKIAIQGSDLFALKGALKTIKQHQMPIIFEYEEQSQDQTSFQDYIDFIHSISYRVLKVVNKTNYVIVPADYNKMHANVSNPLISESIQLSLSPFPFQNKLCKFLKTKHEIAACTQYLYRNGLVSHHLTCKDWDIAHIISQIEDGNFLDMGSSDSYILKNISLKKITGEKYGIDLQQPDVWIKDVKYIIGDLVKTGLPSQFFKNITCLSVLEHQVDFNQFAAEVSRLLEKNGKLYVTFDYWNPKVTPPIKLYELNWQPLDHALVKELITACQQHGLQLLQDFDWSLGESVIKWGYYSPHPDLAYTFGMAVFQKIT